MTKEKEKNVDTFQDPNQKRFLPMLKGIASESVVTRCPATLISPDASFPYPSRSIKRLFTCGSASVCVRR